MPKCRCRRCCIAADLPFALSAERRRQRTEFLERHRQLLSRWNRPEEEPEPEPEPELQTQPGQLLRRDLQPCATRVGTLPANELVPTTLLMALGGASTVELAPGLSVHLRAGAVTLMAAATAPRPQLQVSGASELSSSAIAVYRPPMASPLLAVPYPSSAAVHCIDAVAPSDCSLMVALTEAFLRRGGELTTNRHVAFPTTDIPVADVPCLDQLCQRVLQADIVPKICQAYQLPPGSLLAHDLFVVFYSVAKGGQRGLALHCDESHYSFNLLLSPATDFDGGGTWFEHLGSTVEAQQGQIVCHPGELRHKGVAITRGRRVLLVGFLHDRRRQMFDRPRESSMFEMQLNKDAGVPDEKSVLRTPIARSLVDEWAGHTEEKTSCDNGGSGG
jgi:hypothetical protein